MSAKAKEQALLNEYKGYLFEYLVALNLSFLYKLESVFFRSVSADLQNMLRIQEDYVRKNYPELISDLPVLAKEVASNLFQKLNLNNVQSIDIVGKMIASPISNEFAEADILIVTKSKVYPISLKLSKANAFVNTKSGGVKSFLEKYFPCSMSEKFQDVLNVFLDENFHAMAFELHEVAGIEYPMNFKDWVACGFSELPGELGPEYKEILHGLYYKIIEKIYNMFIELKDYDAKLFLNGLMSLCGLGDRELIQATCFYHQKDKNYQLSEVLIDNALLIEKELNDFQIMEYRKGLAHFEIKFSHRILQIRIKPMNKFTSASFKVNCSVKKN